MTSPSPLLYDTYYHIYNRGTDGENVFLEERNYSYFLQLYIKHVEPVAETFAYCLLRNHFHVLVRVRSEEEVRVEYKKLVDEEIIDYTKTLRVSKILRVCRSPSEKFGDFFNAYAKSINRVYKRTGSLFEHPFGRVPVTSDRQFWNVVAYIHQNPQKHGFVDDFRDWKWSSYASHLSDHPTHLNRAAVLEWFGGRQGYIEIHAEWMAEAQSRWFAADDND